MSETDTTMYTNYTPKTILFRLTQRFISSLFNLRVCFFSLNWEHILIFEWNFKGPWCSERLKAGGEEDKKGWDGWMASWIQWTWVWAKSRRWWRTGKPGMLQSTGSQSVRHDWATEQQQTMEYTWELRKKTLTSNFTWFLREVLRLVTGQRTDPANGTAKLGPHMQKPWGWTWPHTIHRS